MHVHVISFFYFFLNYCGKEKLFFRMTLIFNLYCYIHVKCKKTADFILKINLVRVKNILLSSD